MPKPSTLQVFANPFSYVDHEGRPAGACPCDPLGHTPDRRWVGARLHAEKTVLEESISAEERSLRTPRQNTEFEFSSDVQTIPNTPYYRAAIARGELIAADAESALAAGIGDYRHPLEQLGIEKSLTVTRWFAHYANEPTATLAHPVAPPPSVAPAPAIPVSPAKPPPAPPKPPPTEAKPDGEGPKTKAGEA